MSEIKDMNLKGTAETLLIPLYVRAAESQRTDALIKDDKAILLAKSLESHIKQVKHIRMDENDKLILILRTREFDRLADEFIAKHHNAVVFQIGCGLDTRFDRVDNGIAEWYDIDLPEVIELRQKLLNTGGERYHLIANSAFDYNWMSILDKYKQRYVLFLAEGVFTYFEENHIKSLILMLRNKIPGAEIVFDAFSPHLVRINNLKIKFSQKKIEAAYRWGLKNSKDIEKWGDGIRLLSEWYPFNYPIPRLNHIKWMRHITIFAKIIGIYHFKLGKFMEY